MSLLGPTRHPTSTVIKGSVDASLSANLPTSPAIGDIWIVSVAGDFQNAALVSPANYDFTIGDAILWDGTNWLVRESGDDSLKTTLNLSDLASASTARTNLDVYSTTETDNAIDTDIATHNGVTTAHGISAFGSTLVDDADSLEARTTLDVPSTTELTLSTHEEQEQWYNIIVPQNTALGVPPFTSYTFFEHFKLSNATPFDVMIRSTGDGTDIAHYGRSDFNLTTDAEIQNLVANALTDYSSPNQSGDSITGTARIVFGSIIKSQFNNISGLYEVHIYLQDNGGSRVALTGTFNIATTAASPTTEMRYSDLSTVGGSEEFADESPATSSLIIDFRPILDAEVDAKITTHNGVTTAHGISAFGSTLVDDADAATAQSTLGLASTITKVAQQDATSDIATQTYTIQLTDHGKTLFFTYAGAVTITLPASIGDTVHVTCVVVDAAGSLAFVDDATSTIVSKGSLFSVTDQYGVATAVHRGSNAWYLFGNLA